MLLSLTVTRSALALFTIGVGVVAVVMSSKPSSLLLVVTAQETNVLSGNGYYLDRFNYDVTEGRNDGFIDYGPEDWGDIRCDERFALESCYAYTDKWETGRDWTINKNYCRWCPIDDPESCNNRHHQSPINLRRAVGFEPYTHEFANECIVSAIV